MGEVDCVRKVSSVFGVRPLHCMAQAWWTAATPDTLVPLHVIPVALHPTHLLRPVTTTELGVGGIGGGGGPLAVLDRHLCSIRLLGDIRTPLHPRARFAGDQIHVPAVVQPQEVDLVTLEEVGGDGGLGLRGSDHEIADGVHPEGHVEGVPELSHGAVKGDVLPVNRLVRNIEPRYGQELGELGEVGLGGGEAGRELLDGRVAAVPAAEGVGYPFCHSLHMGAVVVPEVHPAVDDGGRGSVAVPGGRSGPSHKMA